MLRRGEKKALNAMNHAVERMRFFLPAPARPQKPKERIQTAAEKIFILVGICSSLTSCLVQLHSIRLCLIA